MVPKDLRILIVEDSKVMREIIKVQLRDIGFTYPPTALESAEEGWQILESLCNTEKSIQLILSDWHLPGASGSSFLKKIREKKEYQKIPFLMITTEADISFMIEAANTGSTDYLVKPFTEEDFAGKIASCWEAMKEVAVSPTPAKKEKEVLNDKASDSQKKEKSLLGKITSIFNKK